MRETKRILLYAFYGLILGLFFPLTATALKLYEYQIGLSFSSLRAIHLEEPLMLIIDSAPIILSASYALIGIQAARFQQTSQELDQKIASEHKKTVYEKYC